MSTELSAPVHRVTVLEDRAQVRRQGTLRLPPGRASLKVSGVAPVLADKTLLVQAEGAVVADARVVRRSRARLTDRPEAIRAREEEQRALKAEQITHGGRRTQAQQRLTALARVREQALQELGTDVAWGRPEPQRWQADLDAIARLEGDLRRELVDTDHQLKRITQQLADLDRLLATLHSPETVLGAEIEVELAVAQEGEITVRLDYVVPGACWRPQHRAVLSEDGLTVETFGCVWQNTGEDWTGASLELSTQRASLGAEPPTLGEDLLRTQPKQEQVVVEARDQAIQTTGLGSASSEAGSLPGIDDGGEVRTLRVSGTPAVPSDGRPHRLPLGSFRSEAEVALVAMPERAQAVIRRVRAVNRGEVPLLAGPVELVAEGGRVGQSTVLYVAPAERFELGLGPDPALRIHREAERVDHKPGTLSRWASTDHRVRLRMSNLGGAARTFELVERIPVSEVEEVRVKLDAKESSQGATPDADGHVRWSITLPPGGTAERVLAWRVEKKRDVAGL